MVSDEKRAEAATAAEGTLASLFAPGAQEGVRAAAQRSATHAPPNTGPTRARSLPSLVGLAAKVAVLGALAWGMLFNVSEVRGLSMEPGIHDRDRILVDQISYLVGEVQRGDIVVMRYPLDPSLDYIKRVIALPGEEIAIAFGQVWIDGELLQEPYVDAGAIDPYTRLRATVEEGHYFVMGDNRIRSSDSREFGQVAHELLRGKVQLRIWPPARIGLLH